MAGPLYTGDVYVTFSARRTLMRGSNSPVHPDQNILLRNRFILWLSLLDLESLFSRLAILQI